MIMIIIKKIIIIRGIYIAPQHKYEKLSKVLNKPAILLEVPRILGNLFQRVVYTQ